MIWSDEIMRRAVASLYFTEPALVVGLGLDGPWEEPLCSMFMAPPAARSCSF